MSGRVYECINLSVGGELAGELVSGGLVTRGPPVSVREALRRFERVEAQTVADALRKAQELGITVPMA